MVRFEENWKVGKNGCVVTDNPEGFSETTGHTGAVNIEYYGGTLVCESIWKSKHAKLIAAAPDLLNACQEMLEWFGKRGGVTDDLLPMQEQDHEIQNAIKAIKKALGE